MAVHYEGERFEAYLDAHFAPTTADKAVYVRSWEITDNGPSVRLMKLETPGTAALAPAAAPPRGEDT